MGSSSFTDFSIIHCQDQGDLTLSCENNYQIRILSARKRKLRRGACAGEAAVYESCYSESSAYSTVASRCNARAQCAVSVARILSYGTATCAGYDGSFVLHLIFRCEPGELMSHVGVCVCVTDLGEWLSHLGVHGLCHRLG